MTREPQVFIILVNWNGKAVTLECLESLTKLGYHNHTIVVVDNASTDQSAEAVKTHFPRVVLLGRLIILGLWTSGKQLSKTPEKISMVPATSCVCAGI